MASSEAAGVYQSTQSVGHVLDGQDDAIPLLDACNDAHETLLRDMLSQPSWVQVALAKPLRIHFEHAPVTDDHGKREARTVHARRVLNFHFMLEQAAAQPQPACFDTLFAWGAEHGFQPSELASRSVVSAALQGGDPRVLASIADLDPSSVYEPLGHDGQPLEIAVKSARPEAVAFLLARGATLAAVDATTNIGTPRPTLLFVAASIGNVQTVQVLVDHGAQIAGSGALHAAAESGAVAVMDFLVRQGADLNELLPGPFIYTDPPEIALTWTPMHAAAAEKERGAMSWLQDHGADPSVRDRDGKTPLDILAT